MDDDDLEAPGMPIWWRLVVGLLAVIGLFSVIHWVFSALAGIIRLGITIAIIVVAIAGVRALISRS